MTKPIRIQRKRTKGFNLQAQSPDGRPVVSVCRPGKWGNEFRVVPEDGGYYVRDSEGNYWGMGCYIVKAEAVRKAVRLFAPWIEGKIGVELDGKMVGVQLDITELRGKHLACFCPLDSPCHADVLLELAND